METDALNRDVEGLVEALGVLASDVQAAAALSKTGDTQFVRRVYVRAVFALIEGNINLMAEVILGALERKEVHLRPKEIELLRQERHISDEGALPIVHVKFVPIGDRIAPVFDMFSRLFGKSFRLDKSSTGWVDFSTAIKIRNRINHPKNAASFAVDDSELNAVERARTWFADSVETLLQKCD